MQTIQSSNIHLDWIGYMGPIIAMISNIYALWIQPPYLIGYFAFLFMNSLVNKAIKHMYKESRPLHGVEMETVNIFNLGGIKDIYGMPSGHAQSVAFSLSYLYFVQKNLFMTFFHFCILVLTIFQRWNYRKHTWNQLLVGTILGLLIGFVTFQITKNTIEDETQKNIL